MFRRSVPRTPVAGAVACAVVVMLLVIGRAAGAAGQDAATDGSVTADQMAALMDEGQSVYGANCFECHVEGGVGRKLDGDTVLADKDRVITQILNGSANHSMPSFAPTLTDFQIAGVATFIRNSGDNQYGAVLEADVKRVRDALKNKK